MGLRDRELLKKRQLQSDFTLKTAIDVARQHEQVKVHMSELQTPVVNAVKSRTSQGRKNFQKGAQRQHGVSQHPKCGRCGRDSHRNRLNVQLKKRFVTLWKKKSLRCMLQRKTSNALSCRKFSKQRIFKKWRNWKPSDLPSRVC